MFVYDAFILHRAHVLLDERVGAALEQTLGRFPIPSTLRSKLVDPRRFRNRLRVYRDTKEAPHRSELSEETRHALGQSRYLIVVCTPALAESNYCLEVLRSFAELRGRDRVLCLWVSGQRDDWWLWVAGAFAGHGESRPPGQMNVGGEPLAADVRGPDRDAILKNVRGVGVAKSKQARFKLVAAILECESPDELVRRDRARVLRQLACVCGGLLSVCLCLGLLAARQQQRERLRAEARAILDGVEGGDQTPAPEEYAALKKLANASPELRAAALEEVVTSSELATRLKRRLEYVLHAVMGLDRGMQGRIERILHEYGEAEGQPSAINVAVAELGASLGVDDTDLDGVVTANYLAAMGKTQDLAELASLGSALSTVAGRRSAGNAKAVVDAVLGMMRTKPRGALPAFCSVLVAWRPKLSTDESERTVTRFATMMREVNDPESLRTLGETRIRLAEGVRDESLARSLVAAMAKASETSNTGLMLELADLIAVLGDIAGTSQAAAARRFVKAVEDGDYNAAYAEALKESFARHASKLAATHQSELASAVTNALRKTARSSSPGDFEILSRFLVPLSGSLHGDKAVQLASEVVDLAEDADETPRSAMFEFLGGLGERLPANVAPLAARRLVESMERSLLGSFDNVPPAAEQLARLVPRLPDADVAEIAKDVANMMRGSSYSPRLAGLGRVLSALGPGLPADVAGSAVRMILASVQPSSSDKELDGLFGAVAALGPRLRPADAESVARRIVAMVEQRPGIYEMAGPREALGSIGKGLDVSVMHRIAGSMERALRRARSNDEAAALGRALVALGDQLPKEYVATLVARILSALERAGHERDVGSHVDVARLLALLGPLRDRVTSDQIARMATGVMKLVSQRAIDLNDVATDATLDGLMWSLSARQASDLGRECLSVMENRLRACSELWPHVAAKASAEDARDFAERIGAKVGQSGGGQDAVILADVLKTLAPKLSRQQAERAARHIVQSMRQTRGSYELASLGAAVASLNVTETNALAARRILEAMSDAGGESRLRSLTESYQLLAGTLPAAQAATEATVVVARMEGKTNPVELKALTAVLVSLAKRLKGSDVVPILKSLVCVGDVREQVLSAIGVKAQPGFGGTQWSAISWAESQGIDVSRTAPAS